MTGVLTSFAFILSRKISSSDVDVGLTAQSLLQSLKGADPTAGRTVLVRLVEFFRIFGLTGVAVLFDKVDETELTTNSAEFIYKLIYPLAAHIQLLEVNDFA